MGRRAHGAVAAWPAPELLRDSQGYFFGLAYRKIATLHLTLTIQNFAKLFKGRRSNF